MKKISLLLAIFLLIFTSGCSIKKQKPVVLNNEEELVWAIENYHYDKQFDRLNAITDYLVRNESFTYKGTKAPMQGFYGGILHENPKWFYFIDRIYGNIHLERILKQAYLSSEELEVFLSGEQKFYPDNDEYLDILWGYFYATGDERVINLMCKIQKYEFNRKKRTKAKRTLEKNRAKFPDKVKDCE